MSMPVSLAPTNHRAAVPPDTTQTSARPGTIASRSPAHAEQRHAHDNAPIDACHFRQFKACGQRRTGVGVACALREEQMQPMAPAITTRPFRQSTGSDQRAPSRGNTRSQCSRLDTSGWRAPLDAAGAIGGHRFVDFLRPRQVKVVHDLHELVA